MLLKRIGKSSKESSKRCQLNSKESRRSKKNLRQIWLSCVRSTQNRLNLSENNSLVEQLTNTTSFLMRIYHSGRNMTVLRWNTRSWKRLLLITMPPTTDRHKSLSQRLKNYKMRRENGPRSRRKDFWDSLKRPNLSMSRSNWRKRSRIWSQISTSSGTKIKIQLYNWEDSEIKSRTWRFSLKSPESNWKLLIRWDQLLSSQATSQESVNPNMLKVQDQLQSPGAPEEAIISPLKKRAMLVLRVFSVRRK